jgi:thioredoxin-like negative regulator of GroEL
MKKYIDITERFPSLVLLQILGDENAETRKLMVSMKVKVTPTFAVYRGGSQVDTVTGVSEVKLLRALVDRMTPRELEGHEEDVFELEAAERELAAQEAS